MRYRDRTGVFMLRSSPTATHLRTESLLQTGETAFTCLQGRLTRRSQSGIANVFQDVSRYIPGEGKIGEHRPLLAEGAALCLLRYALVNAYGERACNMHPVIGCAESFRFYMPCLNLQKQL